MTDQTPEAISSASVGPSIAGLTCCLVEPKEDVGYEQFAGVIDVQQARRMPHVHDYRQPESQGYRTAAHSELV